MSCGVQAAGDSRQYILLPLHFALPHYASVVQFAWPQADIDDAAGLDHVESECLSFGDDFRTIAAGVEPEFIAASGGDFIEHLQSDGRRQIDADAVELARRQFRQVAI